MQYSKLVFFFILLTLTLQPVQLIGQDTIPDKDTAIYTTDTTPTPPMDKPKTKQVYRFSIEEGIFAPAERKFNSAMKEAKELNADLILLTLDTYGGAVDVADNIRTAILNSTIPVIVYIKNNAASAGAFISIACDSIYMNPISTIGAAVVVEGGTGGAAGEKYQSYFREKMRATAEKKGRDPIYAEAMVNPDVYIPGVIDTGKILTLTATDAKKVGYCEKIVNNEEEALAAYGITDYTQVEYKYSTADHILRFLTNPAVSGILMSLIFLGIFFELQSPGIGFPLIASLVAATLFFAPHYLDGLVEIWEIGLFVLGLVLIGLEIFVIPGFGIAGFLGIIATATGLVFSLLRNVRFDFQYTTTSETVAAVAVVVGGFLLTTLGGFIVGKRFFNSGLTKKLIFTSVLTSGDSLHEKTGETSLKDKKGIVISRLYPAGKIEIDDERYDAITNGEPIEKGETVIVIGMRGFSLIVEKA